MDTVRVKLEPSWDDAYKPEGIPEHSSEILESSSDVQLKQEVDVKFEPPEDLENAMPIKIVVEVMPEKVDIEIANEEPKGDGVGASGNTIAPQASEATQEQEGISRRASRAKRRTNTAIFQLPITGHTCSICLKNFKRLTKLKDHMLIHSGQKPYKCKVCNRGFRQTTHLNRHEYLHKERKEYQCETCNQTFIAPHQLKRHLRIHSGEKFYSCDVCNKVFTEAFNFKVHLRTHSGEKPYQCQTCQRSFARQGCLKKHELIHTGENQKNKIFCEICEKSFDSCNFGRHMRTHSGEKPHVCQECNKAFSELGELKRHIRTHSGVKPYACDQCSKKFTRPSYLKKHKLKAHAAKYYCGMCMKRFQDLDSLIIHNQIHSENSTISDMEGVNM